MDKWSSIILPNLLGFYFCSGSPGIKENQNDIIVENVPESTVYSLVMCLSYVILEHTYKCAMLPSDMTAVCFMIIQLAS